jgi:hypothetical protein
MKKKCDICKDQEAEFENFMHHEDGKKKNFCVSCYLYNAFAFQCILARNMTRLAEYYQTLCVTSGIIQPERLSEKGSMKEKRSNLRKANEKLIRQSRVCDSLNSDHK